ncbi:MAG: ethanolamine ammonia-lyase subunit EutB [Clostridiales Family XIII bacterium]|jgi:ethanolamine ammonia-lyase large subunit|nr:ethanolamine ammonia-lyase subunit EutB [Clostridiales Family XIII bacterium]
MPYRSSLFGRTFAFKDVKEVLAKANERKSGDVLAGLAADSDLERVAAKDALSQMTLDVLRQNPVIPYEDDEVTRIGEDLLDEGAYGEIKAWTVAGLREWILGADTDGEDLRRVSGGLTAEMVAAVAKLMSNLDLAYAASKMEVTARCNTTIGARGTLASRLQPNHTTDSTEGIRASLLEGLSYGCGDALLGLNPVNDTAASLSETLKLLDDVKNRLEIPTQICALGHISTQMEAVRRGAPTDIIFQSIAGSEKGNRAFGFNADTVREAQSLLQGLKRGAGPNLLYFETGQGSELSSGSHSGADQVTMEARCYAFARAFKPFMVNTVVGFIGPEYLFDSSQVIRAGLEDHFMGKLSGLPMGCDCCYTNHMMADQNDVENLSLLLAAAHVNYIIGVPGGDDIMLNYQTNSYHDSAALREILRLRPLREFELWLEEWGILRDGRLSGRAGDPSIFIERLGG